MQGKYYKKYLAPKLYVMFAKTYPDSDYENLWSSIFTACELFRIIAPPVAEHFAYSYNQDEDINMTGYLEKVFKEWKECL
jgi:aminoglycoside 6-adenylyltransferase